MSRVSKVERGFGNAKSVLDGPTLLEDGGSDCAKFDVVRKAIRRESLLSESKGDVPGAYLLLTQSQSLVEECRALSRVSLPTLKVSEVR